MRNNSTVLISGSDASTVSSAAVDALQLYRASLIASFADTAIAGNLAIQASNDIPPDANLPNLFTPTTWVTVATATFTAGATSVIVPSTELSYRYIRALLTVTTAGTSTVKVTLCAKGF